LKNLDVGKRSSRLSAELYKALADLRDFGFRDQIARAGLSIPSNIVEGYERDSNKEIAKFLNSAKGSAGELRTQIHIGMEVSYIDHETGRRWIQEAGEISRMLHSLIRTVRSRATSSDLTLSLAS